MPEAATAFALLRMLRCTQGNARVSVFNRKPSIVQCMEIGYLSPAIRGFARAYPGLARSAHRPSLDPSKELRASQSKPSRNMPTIEAAASTTISTITITTMSVGCGVPELCPST